MADKRDTEGVSAQGAAHLMQILFERGYFHDKDESTTTKETEETQASTDEVLASVPGITTSVGQPIEHRLSHVLSGTPAQIAIVVQGDDLALLRRLAKVASDGLFEA